MDTQMNLNSPRAFDHDYVDSLPPHPLTFREQLQLHEQCEFDDALQSGHLSEHELQYRQQPPAAPQAIEPRPEPRNVLWWMSHPIPMFFKRHAY